LHASVFCKVAICLEGENFMNFVKKVEWNLTALAMAPLIRVETKERDRRLKERLQRSEQKKLNKE
jgi:hypothetical protein